LDNKRGVALSVYAHDQFNEFTRARPLNVTQSYYLAVPSVKEHLHP
jgi:hypothetical protein